MNEPGDCCYNFTMPKFRYDEAAEAAIAPAHPSIPILNEMIDVLESKANDYAAVNWDDNFTGTAKLAGLTPDQVFHTMIGIKVERLRSLMGGGKVAQNEPVEDTLMDLANYAVLWLTYRRQEEDRGRVTMAVPKEFQEGFIPHGLESTNTT